METKDMKLKQIACRRSYISPTCLIWKIVTTEMVAASPGSPFPESPTSPPTSLIPPEKTDDGISDPNSAKQHANFNAWESWD